MMISDEQHSQSTADSAHSAAQANTPAHGDTAALEAHDDGPSGLPQFDASTYASQLVWLTLTLIALYVIVSRVALPRVTSVLQDREERIAADLDSAKRQRAAADKLREACEAKLAEARSEAQAVVGGAKTELQQSFSQAQQSLEADLAARVSAAEARIAEAKAEALINISETAGEVATDLVSRLTRSAPDRAAVDDAVVAARTTHIG